jgi:trk system potassium uptake protein TrkA
MLAKRMGARQTLAIVNNTNQAALTEQYAIDIAISPAQVTIGALLTHIRRGDVVTVHSIRHGSAEALELVVHGDRTTSHLVGRKIGDLPLDEGVSICALLRESTLLLPDADTVIETGDRVVLFISEKQQIPDVELLFQVAITYV